MGKKDADWYVMSRINLLRFFDVNQTGHRSEFLNRLYQRLSIALRVKKTSDIQGIYLVHLSKKHFLFRVGRCVHLQGKLAVFFINK